MAIVSKVRKKKKDKVLQWREKNDFDRRGRIRRQRYLIYSLKLRKFILGHCKMANAKFIMEEVILCIL